MQFAYVLHMCILHTCSMHINSMYANLLMCAVCSYVTLMRDLHICSIIVKIYATYVLHISIFVRATTIPKCMSIPSHCTMGHLGYDGTGPRCTTCASLIPTVHPVLWDHWDTMGLVPGVPHVQA